MLKLHGFAASNYYNLAKIALLEKGLDFVEVHEFPFTSESVNERSPRAKYPYLETEKGFISESLLIAEYLEDVGQGEALLPQDPFEKAKVREIAKINELYLEWVARRIIFVLFGGSVSDEAKKQAKADLALGVEALARVIKFSPYVAGDTFTLADVSSIVHWPMVRNVAQKAFGEDPFETIEGVEEYLVAMSKRPSVIAANAGQNEDRPKFADHIEAVFSR
jgi:glutathione S-transferase